MKQGAAYTATPCFFWHPQRDLNPCYRLKRAGILIFLSGLPTYIFSEKPLFLKVSYVLSFTIFFILSNPLGYFWLRSVCGLENTETGLKRYQKKGKEVLKNTTI